MRVPLEVLRDSLEYIVRIFRRRFGDFDHSVE